jgi:elongation factor P--beta-lysine ligase
MTSLGCLKEMVIMDETEDLIGKVLHLRQVEKLSYRQIAYTLGIDHKKVGRILREKELAKAIPRKSILDKYIPLIAQWYKQYPRLMAKQVYEKLKSYGYNGCYKTVVRVSLEYRKIKKESYHALTFLPG